MAGYGILSDSPLGDDIVRLCTASESISTLLAANPSLAPGEAWQKLYGEYRRTESAASDGSGNSHVDLDKAAKCGKWGSAKPGELFLRIYHDVLSVVEENPGRAMVSPSLLGSHGTVPLTIISTIPDIARHMGNVIARADREVFLATNYWQNSTASHYITNAIRELDRRAGERGVRIVLKIMYDRGSPKQVLDPHYLAREYEYMGRNVRLPAAREIPNIDMQVMNYHQPVVGTFHCKFMVVDRKIAILQSNNIQDNDNLEMMTHLEGPIVDSFYDMALMSWYKKLVPPLPSYNSPAAGGGLANPGKIVSEADTGPPDTVDSSSIGPTVSRTTTATTTTTMTTATTDISSIRAESIKSLEPRQPNIPNGPDPETRSFLDSAQQPTPRSALEPMSAGTELPQSTPHNQYYDVDIAAEVTRIQASLTPRPDELQMGPISRLLNHTVNNYAADAPPCMKEDEMTPYIPVEIAEQIPIAMVNRPPYGTPIHSAGRQPQNAAWLSALRHARKNVFIQTPTLNADPLVPAIREACERGLDVICYICLGYNDTGELLPKQGGTNEMIAHQLYTSLSEEGRKHLHYFWYVAKDQTRPIPQVLKKRDCHIKLMIVDECIGIQGNGNQDTQSWYHSQEINVMLESPTVCRAWIDGLRRNQNTHIYGMLDKTDGIWRDHEGKEAEGAMGINPGSFSWVKGIMGAIRRVQGIGGF